MTISVRLSVCHPNIET